MEHPIFDDYDDISTISQHMGWTLLAKKCACDPPTPVAPPTSILEYLARASKYEDNHNPKALRIFQNASLSIAQGQFGKVSPCMEKWTSCSDRLVRQKGPHVCHGLPGRSTGLVLHECCVMQHTAGRRRIEFRCKEEEMAIKRVLIPEGYDNFYIGFAGAMTEMTRRFDWEYVDSPCAVDFSELFKTCKAAEVESEGNFDGRGNDVETLEELDN